MADTTISNLYQKSTLNPTDYFVIDDGYKTYKMCAHSVFTSNLSAFNQGTGCNSTIAGGINNTASATGSTVGGGGNNTTSGCYSTISGGYCNNISEKFSNVGGGTNNTVSGYYSNIDGGKCNKVNGNCSSISGGYCNCLTNDLSFVGSGSCNSANGINSTISGGYQNCISNGDSSTIAGGYQNSVCGNYSTVGGGFYNRVNRNFSFIGGGSNNEVNACCAGILGGYYNILNCSNSFAIGSCVMGNCKNTTYVGQDLCVCGNLYVYGSNVTNNVNTISSTTVSADYIVSSGSIVAGNNIAAPSFTDITNGSNSDQWNQAYSNLLANSAIYETPVYGTENQIVVTNDSNDGFPLYYVSLPNNLIAPGDLTISGNLNVVGQTHQVGISALAVQDPIIYLNESLSGGQLNIFDIGLVGHYVGPFTSLGDGTSGYQHTGLIRSAVSGVWTLFSGLTTEPYTYPNLSYTDPYFYIETLRANIYGNLSGNNAYLKNNLGIGTNLPSYPLEIQGSAGGFKHSYYGAQNNIGNATFIYQGVGDGLHLANNAYQNNGVTTATLSTGGWLNISPLGQYSFNQFNNQTAGQPITQKYTAFTILSTGNVGVGTTTPNTLLTVNGSLSATGTAYVGNRILLSSDGSNNSFIGVQNTVGEPSDLAIGINSSTTGAISSVSLLTNGNTRLFVDPNGNVGLGTTTPNQTLTVNGSISSNDTISSKSLVLSGGNILLTSKIWSNGANSGYLNFGDTSTYITNTNGGQMVLSAYGGLLASTYSQSNAININQEGKVGIGVAPTASQLTVSGNLSATGTIYSQNMLNKYVTTIGGGLNNDFTITHTLNTKDVHVTVYDNNTGLIVYPSVQITNSTTIDVVFTTIPAANQYRVVIIG